MISQYLIEENPDELFFYSLYGTFKLVPSCRLALCHSVRRADFCPFDLLMTCPYNNQCRGENQSKCLPGANQGEIRQYTVVPL